MSSSIPQTMRAWQFTTATPGGLSQNLTMNPSTPVPTLAPSSTDQLLIRFLAASLNPADYKVPELLSSLPSPVRSLMMRTPATPSADFCGVVVATSATMTAPGFAVGDTVFGRLPPLTQLGTLAEYLVAPARVCGKLPESGITAEQAASLPCAGVTEYQAIAPHVKPGDKIFINGGSGGTGTFGVQIAKALGCFVTTTCSTGKMELVKGLGADEMIDYTTTNVAEVMRAKGQVYTLCVDNVGAPAGDKESDLYKAADGFLVPGRGRYVQVGGPMSLASFRTLGARMLTPAFLGGGRSKMELFTLKGTSREELERLAGWVVEGVVKPVVEEPVYGFEEVREAFEKLKGGRCAGKIVVRVARE